MKATVDRKVLLELLGKAEKARAKRALLPVLQNYLIQTGKGTLSVTGFDLETQVTATGKAEVITKGAVVAPPTLLTFLKGAKGDTVVLEVSRMKGRPTYRTLKVTVDPLTASFEGLAAEEFPPVMPAEGNPIKAKGLADAIAEVVFCAATEDLRPVLAGVHFKPTEYGYRLEAADGFRLALRPLAVKAASQEFILPRNSAAIATRLFKGTVGLSVVERNGENKDIYITSNGLTLRAVATTGTYPNCDQLVPKGGKAVKLDTAAMLQAIKAIEPVAKEGRRIVCLKVKRGTIIVSARSDDNSVETKVPTVTKGKAKTAFNLRYLKDALAITGPETIMNIKSPQDPVLIRSKSSKVTQVVMPMFVQW